MPELLFTGTAITAMYNYYGIYTACRDSAWRCHIDFDVCRLPVKLTAIAKCAGISVHKNSDVGALREGELGASIYAKGTWHIVYDESLSNEEARMVLAHELGHILLGHEYKYAEHRFISGNKKLESEREADMFAVRLLAPACVLHELSVFDAAGISELCEIPMEVALQRAKRMCVLEARASFYTSELEQQVLEKFAFYICSHRKSKTPLKGVVRSEDV